MYFIVRIWDFLVWTTIFFPLFTGGIWIHKPGLHLELTQINAQVIILGILGLLLHHGKNQDLQSTSSMRLLLWVWQTWLKKLESNPKSSLWFACVFFTILWSGTAISRHQGFQSAAADMGIFTNGIWNFTHGNGFISSLKSGANLLTDHQSPSFMLLFPLFYIFPFPETLLIIQAFALLSCGVALYWLGKQYFPVDYARPLAFIPLLTWFYFPLRNINRFDFHPEILLLPFLLWSIWGIQSQEKWKKIFGIIFFIFALGAKESAAPSAIGVCAAWLLGAAPEKSRKFSKIFACVMIPISCALFVINITVVPEFFGKKYNYHGNYSHLGENIFMVVLSPILSPYTFFNHLFQMDRIKLIFNILIPFALLPFLSWRTLIASIPGFLVIALSQGEQRLSLGFHYVAEYMIGILWSLPIAIATFLKFSSAWYFILLICIFGSYGRSDLYFIRSYPTTPHQRWLKKELFPSLSQASFSAPDALTPHLALRPWIHFIPLIDFNEHTPGTVDCVILDKEFPQKESDELLFLRELKRLHYEEIYSCNGFRLFQLENRKIQCLLRRPTCE